jgi:hypothetical protein
VPKGKATQDLALGLTIDKSMYIYIYTTSELYNVVTKQRRYVDAGFYDGYNTGSTLPHTTL